MAAVGKRLTVSIRWWFPYLESCTSNLNKAYAFLVVSLKRCMSHTHKHFTVFIAQILVNAIKHWNDRLKNDLWKMLKMLLKNWNLEWGQGSGLENKEDASILAKIIKSAGKFQFWVMSDLTIIYSEILSIIVSQFHLYFFSFLFFLSFFFFFFVKGEGLNFQFISILIKFSARSK